MNSPSELPPPARLVPVPRPGGVRWLAFLDAGVTSQYRSRVARVAPQIDASLRPGVVANRLRRPRSSLAPGSLGLEPWRAARRRFAREARRLAASRSALLVTDVRDCFGSIGPKVVERRLLQLGCRPDEVDPVIRCLDAFAEQGIPGLPIGPEPSAVLANAVLEAGDWAIVSEGGAHLRWVDDFLVFARDPRHAKTILGRLEEALGELGLAISEAKTRIVEEPELALVVLERSGISDLDPRL